MSHGQGQSRRVAAPKNIAGPNNIDLREDGQSGHGQEKDEKLERSNNFLGNYRSQILTIHEIAMTCLLNDFNMATSKHVLNRATKSLHVDMFDEK